MTIGEMATRLSDLNRLGRSALENESDELWEQTCREAEKFQADLDRDNTNLTPTYWHCCRKVVLWLV